MMQLARTGALISIYGISHFSAEFGEYDHVICDFVATSSQILTVAELFPVASRRSDQ